VEVEINENDIVNIHLEDTATVEVDAFRGKKFKGKVIEIGFSPTNATSLTGATDDQVTSYPVKVLILPESYTNDPSLMKGLPEKASPFRPGMSGVVNIYTDRADDVVAVPIQAVTTGVRGGASFGGGGERGGDREGSGRKSGGGRRGEPTRIVYLYDAATKTVQTAEVTTGISDDAWMEIKSGLAPGQVIVTGPYDILTKELKDGMEVELEEKKGRKGKGDRERGSKTYNAATTPATDPAKPTQPTHTTPKKRPEGTEGRPKSERSREQQ
jgi:HlyD family secretion protein